MWSPQIKGWFLLKVSFILDFTEANNSISHGTPFCSLQAESYHNTGMLNEILGDLSAALDCYEKYLKISKQNSNKRSVAQAYGCLGGVHAGLCNWPMAVMYHQQYIAMAAKLGDARMVAMANEMLGDTYMLREEFDKAVQLYETVISACTHNESRLESVMFKLEFLNLLGCGGPPPHNHNHYQHTHTHVCTPLPHHPHTRALPSHTWGVAGGCCRWRNRCNYGLIFPPILFFHLFPISPLPVLLLLLLLLLLFLLFISKPFAWCFNIIICFCCCALVLVLISYIDNTELNLVITKVWPQMEVAMLQE